jgi:nucleotide-binding universal stress UspA family protein
MQTPRTLLLHVDDTARLATRVAIAVELANRFEAQVDAHYASLPSLLASPGFGDAVDVAEMAVRLDEERQARARAAFEKIGAGSQRLHWLDVDADVDAFESLRRHAVCSDLTIVGQSKATGVGLARDQPLRLVPDLLERSGRPALVIPFAGPVESIGHRIVVAWKQTAGSARALAAAVPWMRQARSVDVLTFGKDAGAELAGVGRYLAGHKIEASLRPWPSAEKDVGERLLSEVADRQGDLLVMGCYGHSRVHEWVLGGVTRTILRSMTVPVLMTH